MNTSADKPAVGGPSVAHTDPLYSQQGEEDAVDSRPVLITFPSCYFPRKWWRGRRSPCGPTAKAPLQGTGKLGKALLESSATDRFLTWIGQRIRQIDCGYIDRQPEGEGPGPGETRRTAR